MVIVQSTVRMYDSVGMFVAFSSIGNTCIWLLRTRLLGHRMLIAAVTFFCVVRATASAATVVDLYFHGQTTHSWTATSSLVASLVLAFMVQRQRVHLRRTLSRTETAHILEVEQVLNGESTHNMSRYLDEQNLKKAGALLEIQSSALSKT